MNSQPSKFSISSEPLYLYDFGIDNIMSYCDRVISETALDLSVGFTKVHAKAASMCKEKYVSNIEFIDMGVSYEVYAKVSAEQSKRTIYKVSATISKKNKVQTAACECPGGAEPAVCKHSLALVYTIESYSQRELYSAPTEQLHRWHQVKPKKHAPVKFSIEDQENQDPIEIDYQSLSQTNFNFTSPFFDVLNTPLFNVEEALYSKSIPLPSIVVTKLDYNDMPNELDFNDIIFLHQNIMISYEDAFWLEKETVQQSKNITWKNARVKRLTSSLFFDIVSCKSDFTNLANKIFISHENDISDIPAIKYGRINEPLIQNVIRQKYSDFVFRKTGLIVNPFFPYLRASPDGLLHNSEDSLLVEIKCVFNPQNLDLFTLVQRRKQFCLKFDNENFKLRSDHKYMYQIQGQLAISNLTKCLFVLMYQQNMPLYIKEIQFDNQMWLSIKSKLANFYFQNYLSIINK